MSQAADQPIEHAPPIPPPWDGGKDITVSQLEEVRLRGSREDARRMIYALQQFGSITVIPDP